MTRRNGCTHTARAARSRGRRAVSAICAGILALEKSFILPGSTIKRNIRTKEFKAEFDEVVNTLREKDGLLCSRDSMSRFCYQHPEAEFEGTMHQYGFRVQTPQHTPMLRCNPNYGDYDFYLYAYVARFLEHHMEKANRASGLSRPLKNCSVSDGTTSAFSLAAEEPATVPAGLSTKPILKPARVFQRPLSFSGICRVLPNSPRESLRSSLPEYCYLSSHNEGNRHCKKKKVKVGTTAATSPPVYGG